MTSGLDSIENEAGNKRNSSTNKPVRGELAKLEISVPLEPKHVPDRWVFESWVRLTPLGADSIDDRPV